MNTELRKNTHVWILKSKYPDWTYKEGIIDGIDVDYSGLVWYSIEGDPNLYTEDVLFTKEDKLRSFIISDIEQIKKQTFENIKQLEDKIRICTNQLNKLNVELHSIKEKAVFCSDKIDALTGKI